MGILTNKYNLHKYTTVKKCATDHVWSTDYQGSIEHGARTQSAKAAGYPNAILVMSPLYLG